MPVMHVAKSDGTKYENASADAPEHPAQGFSPAPEPPDELMIFALA